jgi:peptidoglycan/xylan/chitin deacetylase (PgdA/CDA1 family)
MYKVFLVTTVWLMFGVLAVYGSEPPQDKARTSRKLALTFDDAPFPSTKFFSTSERTAVILKQLHENKCPPVGVFTVGQYIKEFGDNEIQAYDDAGHIICNHSYSHPALSKISAEDFVADIKLADARINSYKGFRKYFRFPYLDYGSHEKAAYVSAALKDMMYQDGYVTIYNHDWYVNALLLRGKSDLPWESFKKKYVQMILDCAAFTDYLFKYDKVYPVQILLLHENDLNALCLSDVINALRERGWEIVSVEEAYQENNAYLLQNRSEINRKLNRLYGQKSALMDLKVLDRKFSVINKKD